MAYSRVHVRPTLVWRTLVVHYIISCWIISSVTTVFAVVVFGVAACGASFVVSVSSGPVIQVGLDNFSRLRPSKSDSKCRMLHSKIDNCRWRWEKGHSLLY